MPESEAESAFEAIRFADKGGEPFCVWCDCEAVYRITRNVTNRKTGKITSRRLFKCQKCLKQFSVTSGTMFHGRKLAFKKIMAAVLLFADGAAGKAALHLRRDIKCNHKTAWTLQHRLREAMTSYVTARRLTGPIEMDSTDFGGKVRKANRAEDRKNQPRRHMDKVVTVSVLRERGRHGRVVPFLGNEAALVKVINTLIDPLSKPFVDEHPAWNALFAQFPVRQIKHKDRYSDLHGTSTNLAESYFSRFKRMYNGTYRHFSRQYAQAYNGECAWREEHRRSPNGDQFILIAAGALHHPPSPIWRGYYQRTLRKAA
ncbi:MAG: IS1595 family transposase [Sphingomonas sp.]|uniref:IS1595 family transposase n=1 Tax=Sphingomonas sp. TaxID=28214 RepID=UPI0025F0A333|nr:IS1595 family transposase [Sphingomonas sp.]MBX3564010.1 IS1595 family transposase [Sphingomonas sp.]